MHCNRTRSYVLATVNKETAGLQTDADRLRALEYQAATSYRKALTANVVSSFKSDKFILTHNDLTRN